MAMEITALVLLLISCITGFICIFFTNFGTSVIMGGCILYALMTRFDILGWKPLILLGILYVFGETIEYLSVVIGAKKFGASNKAVIGAIVGGIIGSVAGTAFFGIGLIPGTFLGIFFGAFIIEFAVKRDLIGSLKAGTGSVIGRVGAIIAKVFIALLMFGIVGYAIIRYLL